MFTRLCRVTSPVDGRSLEGVSSIRVRQDSEFELDSRSIKCTEVSPRSARVMTSHASGSVFTSRILHQVFYLLKSPDVSLPAVLTSSTQFQREIATASCAALCPHLSVLMANGINHLALRVSTDSDVVIMIFGSFKVTKQVDTSTAICFSQLLLLRLYTHM